MAVGEKFCQSFKNILMFSEGLIMNFNTEIIEENNALDQINSIYDECFSEIISTYYSKSSSNQYDICFDL